VRIRMRKPWVFLRFRLFGWKVFFMSVLGVAARRAAGRARKYIGRPSPTPVSATDTPIREDFRKKVAKNPLARGCP